MKEILAHPALFGAFNRLLGAPNAHRLLAEKHFHPRNGDRVLDIGCGTAEVLDYIPPVDYVGFDLSPVYVETAQKRYRGRARFFCRNVTEMSAEELGTFDLVIAKGVLHHLNDAETEHLLRLAFQALKPGARLVTFDGCFSEGQPRLERWLLKQDRGGFVRDCAGYEGLARRVFPRVQSFIYRRLLRIPYTHIVMECTRVPGV